MKEDRAKNGSDNLHTLEANLERIFSSLGHGMYVVDVDRRILLWNRAAETILGWKEEEALGKDCREFINHLDDEGVPLCDEKCPLRETIDGSRTVFAGTVWGHARSGDLVPLNVSCAPLPDDEGRTVGAVEVFADVTREKEIDRMKSEVCSVVAHELRTPLTSMKGYLEMVIGEEAGPVSGQQREFLSVVADNITRLEALTNKLLDLNRLEHGRMAIHWEELDLVLLIEEVLGTFARMAEEKGLRLVKRIDSPPPVHGDRQLIRQVISNLISNAIKYTDEGTVRVVARENGDSAVFEVHDTGVGIPEDEIERIGEKFFRASTAEESKAHGSGLGLSITREIIERHEGALSIESSPGAGSRFKVSLPKSRERTIIRG